MNGNYSNTRRGDFEVESGYMLVVLQNNEYAVYLPGDMVESRIKKRGTCIPYDPIRADFIQRYRCTVPKGMVWAYRFQNSARFCHAGEKVTNTGVLVTGKLIPHKGRLIEDWKAGRYHREMAAYNRANKDKPVPAESFARQFADLQAQLLVLMIVVAFIAVSNINWAYWVERISALMR